MHQACRCSCPRLPRCSQLSARAYLTSTLKVARSIADLDGAEAVRRIHVAEALSLKRQWAGAEQAGFVRAG